ncbi:lysylphosphatidylglycerol synthase transmembrane domain-containing protein [Parapedobacter lycopersici]|uniref:lysylphosphatidylglycerol synthase transmembrane domain-containing protein n=1 Tax=Parapedobacter lycopersici TaxID=1864939 RepID=UPI00214DDC1A|nr:lysylphosphatidylglycerol synthase transmembrane domain-containing protein [Parapedobacter lycopersici]
MLMKFWRTTKTLLKISVTALALYWVFGKVEPRDLREALVQSNPLFLVLAFIAYCGSILIASSRLNGFFKGMGLHLSERYNLKLYLLGLFYNLFLPGGVGGDGYKIYFLRRKFHVKGRHLLTAVFFDRVSGLWALCLITAALVLFIPQLNIPREVPIACVIAGSAAYYFVINKYFNAFSRHFLITHLKALGVQSMQVVCAILLLYALGFDGKFSPYLFMFLLSSLVAVVPFTVGGLGAREMVYVYGAEYFQLDAHLAVLISLLFYLTSALLAVMGSYFIFRPRGLGEDKLPTTDEVERGVDDEND